MHLVAGVQTFDCLPAGFRRGRIRFSHAAGCGKAEPMSDLAKLVIKRFPENRNLQLVSFRTPARFHCSRCKKTQIAKVAAVVAADWEQLLCAACYEQVLSAPPEENTTDQGQRQ